MSQRARLDVGISLFLIAVSAAFLWDSRNIKAAVFDKLGPAPVPRLICAVVIVLCVIIMIQAFLKRPAQEETAAADFTPRPVMATVVLLATGLYIAVMASRRVSFSVATIIFLTLTISGMCGFRKRGSLAGLIIAVIMGLGCQYLFTEVFVIDLPTGN